MELGLGRGMWIKNLVFGDQIDGGVMFMDVNIWLLLDGFEKSRFHIFSGMILDVYDAMRTMAALNPQVESSFLCFGKSHSQLKELFYPRRSFFDNQSNSVLMTQAGPGRKGVLCMLHIRIPGIENRSDPSLGIIVVLFGFVFLF